jgi:pentapeptide MXKDX repeat protein
MKLLISAIVSTGVLCLGAQALADDSMQSDSSSHHQMMKDCVAKHAAKNDGMSESDMKAACKDEMKTHKDHASVTSAPANAAPTDAPTDPTTDKTIGTATSSNK